MIDVKDEVLSSDELYYIVETRDIYGNRAYRIELATDVTQSGTPLNKVLFDSIRSHLLFNGICHKLKGLSPTNYSIPRLTDTNRQGHTITWDYLAVTTYAPSNAYEMFGDKSKYFLLSKNQNTFLNLFVTLPNFVKITNVGGWRSDSSANLRLNFKLLGRVSSSDPWENLISEYLAFENDLDVNSNKAYKYLQFQFTPLDGYDAYVRNGLTINGKQITSMNCTEELDYKLDENLTVGQILNVEVPSNYVMYDNITYKVKASKNQSINLPKNLVAGNRYSLMYNGSNFIV